MAGIRSPKTLGLPEPVYRHFPVWKDILEEAHVHLRNDIKANSITRVTTATDYTASRFDTYIGVTNTDANRTITLPPAARAGEGHIITVKDESGILGDNAKLITIEGDGTETLDGDQNPDMNANYDYITVISDGVSKWFIIAAS